MFCVRCFDSFSFLSTSSVAVFFSLLFTRSLPLSFSCLVLFGLHKKLVALTIFLFAYLLIFVDSFSRILVFSANFFAVVAVAHIELAPSVYPACVWIAESHVKLWILFRVKFGTNTQHHKDFAICPSLMLNLNKLFSSWFSSETTVQLKLGDTKLHRQNLWFFQIDNVIALHTGWKWFSTLKRDR